MELTFSGKFDNTIHIEERFHAPREKLFVIWIEADQLKNWFMTEEGFKVTSAQVNPVVSGNYRLELSTGPGNPDMWIAGKYLEISKPERLSYTWTVAVLDGKKTFVEVVFEDDGDGCRIHLTHGVFDSRVQTRSHADGWVGCFRHLTRYLETEAA